MLFKGPGWTPGKPRLGDPADLPEVFSLCGILKVNSSCNSPFVVFILCAYLGISVV